MGRGANVSPRRMATLRRLQESPATWPEIRDSIGKEHYPPGVESERQAVKKDIDWLRESGCEIALNRDIPGKPRYVLKDVPLQRMSPAFYMDGTMKVALCALEREWADQEGEMAKAVRTLLDAVRRNASNGNGNGNAQ